MWTTCEECGEKIFLSIYDADGIFIGEESDCGYYVTRYMPGMEPVE